MSACRRLIPTRPDSLRLNGACKMALTACGRRGASVTSAPCSSVRASCRATFCTSAIRLEPTSVGGVPVVPPAHNAADARRIGGTRRYTQQALRRFTSHAADALLHDPLGMPAAFDAMPHADALKTATDHCTRSAQARAEVLESAQEFAQMEQTPVSLHDMREYGQQPEQYKHASLLAAATFLHRELPIRLAHRITELEALPYGLSDTAGVKRCRDWYVQSFSELVTCPVPRTNESEEHFAQLLATIYERHANTLINMSAGLAEVHKAMAGPDGQVPIVVEDTISPFLDSFYSSRIGIRTLIQQHLAMRQKPEEGWAGVIKTDMSPEDVALKAINDATQMCERALGDAPEVEVIAPEGFTFGYIPSYLHHMLFEVIKNSMRAVVEHHGVGNVLPPVRVVVSGCNGNEDCVIKVADEGGGIPRSAVDRVWKYMYTTAQPVLDHEALLDAARDFGTDTPLAGLGYGLPLSRLYARYWGGELQIISMEGFGTDTYLHLRLDGASRERVATAGAGFWRAAANAFAKTNHPATA